MSLANRSGAGLPGCGQTYSRGPRPGATATVTGWPDTSLGRVGVWLHLTNTGSRVTEGRFGSPIITVAVAPGRGPREYVCPQPGRPAALRFARLMTPVRSPVHIGSRSSSGADVGSSPT